MNKIGLFLSLTAVSLTALTQCQPFVEGLEVHWQDSNDEHTVNYEYIAPNAPLFFFEESTLVPGVVQGYQGFVTSTIATTTVHFGAIYPGPISCTTALHIDVNGHVHASALEATATSGCGNNDGSICYNVPGWSFTVDGTASVNGCVTNLAAGDYTVSFDPWTSSVDGMVHYNEDVEVNIGDFSIALEIVGDDLVPVVSGGEWSVYYLYRT